MARRGCYVGTSGWSYAHWAKGRFYPKGLKPGEWLGFLARQFNTVEVNASFYRPPRPEMIARWREATGAGFLFAVKLWRRITHDKRLTDIEPELSDFFAVVNGLEAKRGPLLVQLPPSFRKDLGLLETFLTTLRQVATQGASKTTTRRPADGVAIEFRNSEWICDEVYALLDRYDATVCLSDIPRCPVTRPNNTSFVYVRRHGPGGRYRGCYTPAQIAADAADIRQWLDKGRRVFVYYNNDVDGYAVDNARALVEAIGL